MLKAPLFQSRIFTLAPVALSLALTACGGGSGGGGGGNTPNPDVPASNTFLPANPDIAFQFEYDTPEGPSAIADIGFGEKYVVNSTVALYPLEMPIDLGDTTVTVHELMASDTDGIRLWGYQIENFPVNTLLGTTGSITLELELATPLQIFDAEGGAGSTLDEKVDVVVYAKLNGISKSQYQSKLRSQLGFGYALIDTRAKVYGVDVDPQRIPVVVNASSTMYGEIDGKQVVAFDMSFDLYGLGASNSTYTIASNGYLQEGLGFTSRVVAIDEFNSQTEFTLLSVTHSDVLAGDDDVDDDSWFDIVDAFPNDPSEQKDADGDGFGDNDDDSDPSDPLVH